MSPDRLEELLLQVSKDISEIKTKISAINKALWGNGHPGLVEKVNDLEQRMASMEAENKGRRHSWALIGGIAAFVISTLVNVASMVFGR